MTKLIKTAEALIDALIDRDSDFENWETVIALSEAIMEAKGKKASPHWFSERAEKRDKE